METAKGVAKLVSGAKRGNQVGHYINLNLNTALMDVVSRCILQYGPNVYYLNKTFFVMDYY